MIKARLQSQTVKLQLTFVKLATSSVGGSDGSAVAFPAVERSSARAIVTRTAATATVHVTPRRIAVVRARFQESF